MRRKLLIFFFSFGILFLFGVSITYSADGDEPHDEKGHHQGHHKAHHGGVLNVIGKCETGHIEVRLKGDTLETWLVGGGHDTHRAVPVKARQISLTVAIPGQAERTLVLKADPMKLAGEHLGNCSSFTAKAGWLKDVKQFEARGELIYKGVSHELLIKYPEGYDPEHANGQH
jgi:hypothetical protein